MILQILFQFGLVLFHLIFHHLHLPFKVLLLVSRYLSVEYLLEDVNFLVQGLELVVKATMLSFLVRLVNGITDICGQRLVLLALSVLVTTLIIIGTARALHARLLHRRLLLDGHQCQK